MIQKGQTVFIEISPGELIDKLTILEIKLEKITDTEKLKNIRCEYTSLSRSRDRDVPTSEALVQLTGKLKSVNVQLWDIEDKIRMHEKNQVFDSRFVELARSVYLKNDLRATCKREINKLLGAEFFEEKSYQSYRQPDKKE